MKTEIYKRTDAEIVEAVEKLKANKAACKHYNMFGSDNWAKHDVRIDTIQNQRSEDYVYKTYPSSNEEDEEDMNLHDLWQAGMSGLEYLRGQHEIEDLLIPIQP